MRNMPFKLKMCRKLLSSKNIILVCDDNEYSSVRVNRVGFFSDASRAVGSLKRVHLAKQSKQEGEK